ISLLAVRRTAVGKSILVAALASLCLTYGVPIGAAFRAPQSAAPLATLAVPVFSFPTLAVPRPARATAPEHRGAALRPIARASRAGVAAAPAVRTAPVVTNRYVREVAPAKPKAAQQPPTYEDSVGAAPPGVSLTGAADA